MISLFDTEFALKGAFPKKLSKDFHKAFELRQVSDYKTGETIPKEKAEETLSNAVSFVEAVRKYLVE